MLSERKFVFNKYYYWYVGIIAKAFRRDKLPGYECHHIVPKCMGGTSEKNNLVYLTLREHFIAHWLLPKCAIPRFRRKLLIALSMMKTTSDRNIRVNSAWQFKIIRQASKEARKGIKFSLEHKMKISKALTGIKRAEATKAKLSLHFKGVPISEERRLKMLGKVISKETREKLSKALKGKPRPPEVIEKIKQSHLLLNRKRKENADLCLS